MTRKTLNRLVTLVVAALLVLIGLAFAAKFADPATARTGGYLAALYEFIKDTSILIATVAAAYLAGLYQKRNVFLQSLREQWHEIVQAKSALIYYLHLENPSPEDYLHTARQLSETIDNMRIVYSNVGETDDCIGLYPYAPLHHMRLTLEALDPRKGMPAAEQRYAARGEIWDAFNAIREHMLDEFDIDEPSKPILVFRMKRQKKSGAAGYALKMHAQQDELAQEAGKAAKDVEYTVQPPQR